MIATTGDLPGPTALPFIAHLHDLIRHKGQILKQFQEYRKKYGRLYAMFLVGKKPCVVVADPEIVKHIMVKEFSSFRDRPSFVMEQPEPFDSMMTSAKYEKWHRIRNTLSPAFSAHKMKLMVPLINSSCDVLINKLTKVAESGESFFTHKFHQGLTMDTILKTAFGIQSEAQTNYDDPAFKAARKSLSTSTTRRVIVTLLFLMPFKNYIFKAFPSLVIGNFEGLLEMTKMIVEVKKSNLHNEAKDMLDLMLSAAANENTSKKLSDMEVLAQSLIFLIAGYETTNITLSFVAYSLATNPEVQEKLQREIDSVWTEEDEMPSYDTVHNLPYLDMVISETLRLYPPGFVASRECTQDCVIKGYRFRKGLPIFIDAYSMHHDPEFWTDPERFDPERFSSEANQSRDPYSYLPFGHGPHNCVGMRFAQMEMKLALVRVLKKFSYVATADTPASPPVVVRALLGCDENMRLGIKFRD
ncbi:predicted protein [Nematostella vectensis]|uniref:Cytochrome P450 n=1 Tax=Nematostella vectensis TaxID=45351 RepID=A7SRX8_NEMVE|nr:predicted protein [Nematostella vectensis]|eukprot:XP_001625659.1 predicted protein [Nematostella vectensis]